MSSFSSRWVKRWKSWRTVLMLAKFFDMIRIIQLPRQDSKLKTSTTTRTTRSFSPDWMKFTVLLAIEIWMSGSCFRYSDGFTAKTICYWKQVNDANDQQCLGRDFKGAKHREGQSTSQNWNIKFLCSVMISVPILLTANQSNTQVPATSARRWNSRIGRFTPKLTNRRLPARWE